MGTEGLLCVMLKWGAGGDTGIDQPTKILRTTEPQFFFYSIVTIAALSLSIGIGFTSASEIGLWGIFPEVIQSVFSANVVAVVFVVSIVLNLILPKNMEVEKLD